MVLYGLKSCDGCRKALKALEASGRVVEFRDVRSEPLDPEEISEFFERFGEALVNRRSTTWRGLPEAARAEPGAALLAAHPALMKRPVIADGADMTLGWDKAAEAHWLG